MAMSCEAYRIVMPGPPGPAFGRPECKLVPGIHVFVACPTLKTWMAGTSPAMTPECVGERSAQYDLGKPSTCSAM